MGMYFMVIAEAIITLQLRSYRSACRLSLRKSTKLFGLAVYREVVPHAMFSSEHHTVEQFLDSASPICGKFEWIVGRAGYMEVNWNRERFFIRAALLYICL